MFRLLHGVMEFKVGPLSSETGLTGSGVWDTVKMITPGMVEFYMPRSFQKKTKENGVDDCR